MAALSSSACPPRPFSFFPALRASVAEATIARRGLCRAATSRPAPCTPQCGARSAAASAVHAQSSSPSSEPDFSRVTAPSHAEQRAHSLGTNENGSQCRSAELKGLRRPTSAASSVPVHRAFLGGTVCWRSRNSLPLSSSVFSSSASVSLQYPFLWASAAPVVAPHSLPASLFSSPLPSSFLASLRASPALVSSSFASNPDHVPASETLQLGSALEQRWRVPIPMCMDTRGCEGRRLYSGEPRIRNKNSSHTSEWIKRQITDRYVLRAQERNLRSRAAFKLEQLDDEFMFFRKNQIVIDLGAYPGGWSQVALDRIRAGGGDGRVIAVDPVAMDPLPHHTFIQSSVGQAGTLQALLEELGEAKADVVLSDMAPSCIGVKQDDHLNSAELCLYASDLMEQVLKLGGTFVTKIFMGSETNNFKVYLRTRFKKVSSAKPKACRSESREMYFVCQHFLGRERLAEEVQLKGCFTGKEGYL
ncbi:ribosomal RNA methyltransferase (FtsJ) family protein [Besnoitia besnoiti]|uniref:rRNA methyltransferase 2, mitochondrial n=1 Tax=Besnoitia besnoiti TaxID=94643 RepID=A0A2A9MC25_BESBE|nr:ribosomal RNA methyltransferase (FtsJ) family protein [Besnoitia besnoiti]PFH33871.1 ribosomal RNA methyltransferase (FtsJ) family protein [Besnoitia besnoiti]